MNSGIFGFASEIKALVELPDFSKEIDYGAVGDYFKYRYIPSPRSIWKNISKLPHGHIACFDISNNALAVKKYYSLDESILHSKRSTIDDVGHFLIEAVRKRLVSDVEVGTLLSGGIDSSAVSAIASNYHSHITSFSVGFEPDEFSELPYSKTAAAFLKTDHITTTLGGISSELIDQLSYYYDEPLADSSCIPTYLLCDMVSNHVKVALSGDGGDEVFAGYGWYETYLNDNCKPEHRGVNKVVAAIKEWFNPGNSPSRFEDYYNRLLLNRFDSEKFRAFFSPDIYGLTMNESDDLFERYESKTFSSVRSLQYIDMNTFMVDDILTKVDRASMAHSLEVRVPFLDHKLVEAVFALPEKTFPQKSSGKPVLKSLMNGNLPQSILARQKKGFSAPLNQWKEFNDISKSVLDGQTLKDGLFQKKFILDLINNKYTNSDGMLWMVYIFEKWYQRWVT